MGTGDILLGGNLSMDLPPVQGAEAILLGALWYGNRYKLRPCAPPPPPRKAKWLQRTKIRYENTKCAPRSHSSLSYCVLGRPFFSFLPLTFKFTGENTFLRLRVSWSFCISRQRLHSRLSTDAKASWVSFTQNYSRWWVYLKRAVSKWKSWKLYHIMALCLAYPFLGIWREFVKLSRFRRVPLRWE